MISDGYVKFLNHTEGSGYNSTYKDLVDNQSVEIQSPVTDLNIHQYFNLFNSFLRAVGFADETIMNGAAQCAFNEMRRVEDMRKVAENNDLVLDEDMVDRLQDVLAPAEERALAAETRAKELSEVVLDLKAQLSRACNPDHPTYTDEEIDAMCSEIGQDIETALKFLVEYETDTSNEDMWNQGIALIRTNDPNRAWDGKVPGSPAAKRSKCCCPTLDNLEMPTSQKWVDIFCPIHGDKV